MGMRIGGVPVGRMRKKVRKKTRQKTRQKGVLKEKKRKKIVDNKLIFIYAISLILRMRKKSTKSRIEHGGECMHFHGKMVNL